jgi:hypothetical protein
MAVAGGRKQRSSRLEAHVPSWDSARALSHGVKTTRPCSVPRTARTRTTATPPTTRPVALTLRQGRRSRRRFTSAIMTAPKRCATSLNFVSFFTSPFSLLQQGPGKEILRKGSFSAKEAGPEPPTDQRFEGWPLGRVQQPPQSTRAPRPLLVRGSKAGPLEGFNGRLMPLGLRAHY